MKKQTCDIFSAVMMDVFRIERWFSVGKPKGRLRKQQGFAWANCVGGKQILSECGM